MKKATAIIMAIVMMFLLLLANAHVFAEEVTAYYDGTGLYSDLECSNPVTTEDKAIITDVQFVGGVTAIGDHAFQECTSITNIIIPAGVTSIGDGAFYSCSRLTSVTIPESVTSIGGAAFANCSSLTSITIPDGVTSIRQSTFYNCRGLTSVTIPESVTSIAFYAFKGCGFTSVTIPGSVTSIENAAFYDCTNLASVTIHDGVTSIGNYMFSNCSRLTTITIPGSITSIGQYAFDSCSRLTSVTIPGSVTSIGGSAFYNCSGLTSVTIPGSVTSIGGSAFYNCSGLTSVTILGSIISIGDGVFANCSSLTSITIPDGVTSIGNYMFSGCSGLTTITIPGSVTSIGEYMFAGCSGLTSVAIPESVISIGSGAFMNCSGLTSAYFMGNTPGTFGNNVFLNTHPDFKILYRYGTMGWASPAWNNYPAEELCQVDFNSRGGTAVDYELVAAGNSVIEPTSPTKEGFHFGGWFKDAACTQSWDFANDTVTEDTTLYAKWLSYTIGTISNQTLAYLSEGYSADTQEIKTITVNRTGTGNLTNLSVSLGGAHADDFTMVPPRDTSLDSTTSSTTFTIKAKDRLAAGVYTAEVTISADHMTPVNFTVTQAVGDVPVLQVQSSGNRYVRLRWDGVSDAVSYSLYKITTPGVYTEPYATVTGSVYSQDATGLTNGTTYYFKVGAVDQDGHVNLSNEASAIPDSLPPAWPSGSGLTASGTTTASTVLNWTAATDDVEVTGYRIYQDSSMIRTVTGSVYSCEVTGLSPSTAYIFRLEAGDADNHWIGGPTVTVRITASSGGGSGGSSGGGSTPAPAPVQQTRPAEAVPASGGNLTVSAPPKVDASTGTAAVNIASAALDGAFDKAGQGENGAKTVKVEIPAVTGAGGYQTTLPASFLTSGYTNRAVEINTGIASVTVPGNMMDASAAGNSKEVSLTVAVVDKRKLDAAVQSQIGDRPVIELNLKLDGKQTSWSNENAPVSVSVPYTPTPEELKDPEHITVWYIDGSGKAIAVPSGKYDPATGKVTFSTTHFSQYAVAFVKKTFEGLGNYSWAKKQIEVLASKGIINGSSDKTYSPEGSITRADYLVLMVRALGLTAEADENFEDVMPDDYYYKEIAIAKKFGITSGSGGNRFNPKENISRQDMMVLTARALEQFKKLKAQGDTSVLDRFKDKGDIAGYAIGSMAELVKEGLIAGSGDIINPGTKTTRAEAAVFLYRIYNKYL